MIMTDEGLLIKIVFEELTIFSLWGIFGVYLEFFGNLINISGLIMIYKWIWLNLTNVSIYLVRFNLI